MDRFGAVTTWDDEDEGGHRLRVDVSYPSRRKVIPAIKEALESGSGPVVLTGEPGSGKTWLSQTVLGELPENYRGLKIDLTPAVGPLGFHRLILTRLGIDPGTQRDVASARHAIENALTDDFANGRRTILVVEEAHNASDAVFEELRAILNHRGRPEGFWSMMVIGQTRLARRLHSRVLAGFSARIGGRIHLRAFDVIEFAESIRLQGPSSKGESLPEMGNVGQAEEDIPSAEPSFQGKEERSSDSRARWEAPPIVSNRPPLHEADGMIEVGWEASSDSLDDHEPIFPDAGLLANLATNAQVQTSADTAPAPEESEDDSIHEVDEDEDEDEENLDEPIHDHYAALQAWNEWSRNRTGGRVESSPPQSASTKLDSPDPTPATDAATFWAEGRQEFAPYSQLFSRFKKESAME